MIIHTNQRMIPPIALSINSKLIAQVSTFNFLGIMLDSNMLWTSHTHLVSMKLSKTIGIINRLKYTFPNKILFSLCNSLFIQYIQYDLLLWGSSIAMLKSCKRDPLDLPLEVTILRILLSLFYIIN